LVEPVKMPADVTPVVDSFLPLVWSASDALILGAFFGGASTLTSGRKLYVTVMLQQEKLDENVNQFKIQHQQIVERSLHYLHSLSRGDK
jgi:hypothetical protein